MSKPDFEASSDFANYFCTYAYLYHQKQMLTDNLRMQSYQDAMKRNPKCFQDKVVLDVGTGSGILAIWAAQAGAKKVYAVEATNMAVHARKIVQANNLGHIITVIQSKIEDVQLDEKVDIIVSEWMGYFLLRESMLDSVLHARDNLMKKDGALYPSHCTMYIAATRESDENLKRSDEYNHAMDSWAEFVEFTKSEYNVDMGCLNAEFREEQAQYSLQTSSFVTIDESQLISEPVAVKTIDLNTCTLEDVKAVHSDFALRVDATARLGGFCGWFDVDFHGCPSSPVQESITLSTSPFVQATHWGQQLFSIIPSPQLCKNDTVTGHLTVLRRSDNQRLMNAKFEYKVQSGNDANSGDKKTVVFQIE